MNSDDDEKSHDFSFEEEEGQTRTWREIATSGDLMVNNADLYLRHLDEAQSRLFCSPEKMKFDILDILNPEQAKVRGLRTSKETFTSINQLDDFLRRDSKPQTRFISIPATNSVKPLQITNSAMRKVLASHEVRPEFLDLLLSFANGGKESEAGPGSLTFKNRPDGACEMQYRISYVEQAGKSWATRQIGVFHRRRTRQGDKGDLWIFLHPRNDSVAQERLEAAVAAWSGSGSGSPGSRRNWSHIHLLVLSSYFGDWRWFLKGLNGEIEHLSSDVLSLDFSQVHYKRGLDALQNLHNLEDKVLPLAPRLRSMLATVKLLKEHESIFFSDAAEEKSQTVIVADELSSYETQIHGHLASVELLEKRVQEILKLLGVALGLKNQATATNINRNILSLTRDTVDDSATVRVVTIVTLVYLPASFMTSLFGMNLFTFQSSPGSGFEVSHEFWLFFVFTVPLTFLTVGSWYLMSSRRKRQKALQRESEPLIGDV